MTRESAIESFKKLFSNKNSGKMSIFAFGSNFLEENNLSDENILFKETKKHLLTEVKIIIRLSLEKHATSKKRRADSRHPGFPNSKNAIL